MESFTIIIFLTMSAVASAAVLPGSPDHLEWLQLKHKTTILYDLLVAENCEIVTADNLNLLNKREILGSSTEDRIHIEAQRALYNKLVSQLAECRKAKTTSAPTSPSDSPSTVATTKSTTTTPTTTATTSTQAPTTTPQITTTTQRPLQKFTGLKIAATSSHGPSLVPQYIIDGTIPNDTYSESFCNEDNSETEPYITVDLGAVQTVVKLVMWQRYESISTQVQLQVQDMEFRVAPTIAGLDDEGALCYRRPGVPTVRPERFNCNTPIAGRYVKAERFKHHGGYYFCFDELEIFGY